MQHFDIIIIGAGWHGLTMAKTHLEVNPTSNLLILDSASSVGGTWAKERLYPGLKTNNLIGSYEFSDFPMSFDRFGVKPGNHIPGTVVHEYLCQFVEAFGLRRRLCLGRRVESVELRGDGSWLVQTVSVSVETGLEKTTSTSISISMSMTTSKLVIATGLTSEPSIPSFQGQESFHRPLFHAKHLQPNTHVVQSATEIVVLGGNKSAWDTAFLAATAGVKVNLVMRPSGGGPSFLWPVFVTPLKLSVQRIATTRWLSLFDPCVWDEPTGVFGWAGWFLHRTWIGRRIVRGFWSLLGQYVAGAHGYDGHHETRKLRPWVGPFWMGNSLSVHNYPRSWFGLVRRGLIRVHVADVLGLSEGTVRLSDGQELRVDAMVCCTGWDIRPPLRFLPEGILGELGLEDNADPVLVGRARREILERIPALWGGPKRTLPVPVVVSNGQVEHRGGEKKRASRYLLYRFLVPPSERFLRHRNIAFIGAHLALSAIIVAQAQALWITAFFANEIPALKLDALDYDRVRYEAVLHNEYTRMRHPAVAGGAGERCPDLTFDCLPYIDLLLRDLGVDRWRKGGVWTELFERYMPGDYAGIVQEWLGRRQDALEKDVVKS